MAGLIKDLAQPLTGPALESSWSGHGATFCCPNISFIGPDYLGTASPTIFCPHQRPRSQMEENGSEQF
ncbi:hypothetical protein AMTR_s00016p00085540 [Amborella trichopoda]|uniref:Uncharacterized protein n=1 Tax=Amborella trichopoda TaxID=13333 RepID=W1PEL1_AMBTC|nr:hypothetical protein AMTR_s00016p00085540 [Amborella trichopoda]